MSLESIALNVPVAPGVGTAQVCLDLTEKWVEVVNSALATVNVEVSFDGTNWHIVATTAAALTLAQVAIPSRYVRINLTALPGAAPTAFLHGKDDCGQGGAD